MMSGQETRLSDKYLTSGSSRGGESEFDDLSTDAASKSLKESSDKRDEEVAKLAQKETRNVRMWRRNVFLMLFATAALVTTLTFLFLREEDIEDFHTSFHQFADTIRDSTKFNLLGVIEATGGLSEFLTAEAIKTNSSWPFVTLSSFEVFVSHTRGQASSELIVVAPLVAKEQLEDWADYSIEHQDWIDESFAVLGADAREDLNHIPSSVYRFGRFKGRTVLKPEDGYGDYPAAPFWQMSRPPFDTSIINFNALSTEEYQGMYDDMIAGRRWVMGVAGPNTLIDYTISQEAHDALHSSTSQLVRDAEKAALQNTANSSSSSSSSDSETVSEIKVSGFANDHPHTALVYPVFQELNNEDSDIVAMVVNILPWDNYLKNALPDGVDGIFCVLHNSFGQVFTYVVNGQDVSYLGEGDTHDTAYDDMEVIINVDDFLGKYDENSSKHGLGGQYWFAIYPSEELESEYNSATPIIFAAVAVGAFVLMTLTFILYDWYVIRKNNKILDAASRSNAILSSLFPQDVKKQLLQEQEEKHSKNKKSGVEWPLLGGQQVDGFMNDGANTFYDVDGDVYGSKPIADLFPDATVLFADLVGFTAWSSTREPTSVFILLETLFNAFDKIAVRKRVYKVETIGDCYVAVTGLPEPNPKHAEDMCKFAKQCFLKMQQLTNKLEAMLGPDTSNLSMRFGLHSGPVTAGVLRGERSRFQLFGDTMNTASRMESTGLPGKIHLSQDTADILFAVGKGHMVEKREDKVIAKGKGEMQTFWLVQSSHAGSMTSFQESTISGSNDSQAIIETLSSHTMGDKSPRIVDNKTGRLIQWNVTCFRTLLKSIAISRSNGVGEMGSDDPSSHTDCTDPTSKIPLEEVTEAIDFSNNCGSYGTASDVERDSVALPPEVGSQLVDYITVISGMYNDHPFHCFQHASHVVMSVLKLFSRFQDSNNKDNGNNIIDTIIESEQETEKKAAACFTSDPLVQFACAFAALIHDILHPGVPNSVLIQEEPDIAEHYKMRSVAEQRSFEVAWELLMDDRYHALRAAIYQNREEEERFRQLVVNSLMATDIMDPELKKLRNERWERAFSDEQRDCTQQRSMDRKATIMIEHLIQTSDVSHTMQHWNVFRKWNERLFQEMYKAYKDGRSDKDPSEFWYKGELGFFDFYVIPLAERLRECGETLKVKRASDEYLSYAKKNRKEWEEKGVEIVAAMTAECLAASAGRIGGDRG